MLWGNPGTGKTTFARIVQAKTNLPFVEFSAVLGGVKEVRAIVADAEKSEIKPTILFVDEIHRFSKSQQDAFLPHVEAGTVILIGATTENPSFYLNSALLSRVRVLRFQDLSEDSLGQILDRALNQLSKTIADEVREPLLKSAGGDARILLNILEQLASFEGNEISSQTLERLGESEQKFLYDRSGEEHYNLISAFIKSLRGSSADAALYWGFRMLESGEDPRFLIRRMIIFASEDIGNSDPRALTLASTTLDVYEKIGLPEARIPISQCITYLATAPKSNRSYAAMHKVLSAIKQSPRAEVPMHLRNAPTKLMKQEGYGKGYQYPHEYDGAFIDGVEYLPDSLSGQKFYEPSTRGYEKTIGERLEWLKKNSKRKIAN